MELKADSQNRAQKFIEEVIEDKTIYYVEDEGTGKTKCFYSNEFQNENGEPVLVVPFWSKSYVPYAKKWLGAPMLREIPLLEFLDFWLADMDNDGIMVGVNWNQRGVGFECTATQLFQLLDGIVNAN